MNRDKLRSRIIDKISNFGDGELEFETRDIEELINWIDELQSKLSNLTIPDVVKPFYCLDETLNYGRCNKQCNQCKVSVD